MKKPYRVKLDNITDELAVFLERDFSSQFRNLTQKEDRQLFFLARVLVRLKHVSEEIQEDEKILIHPTLQKSVNKDNKEQLTEKTEPVPTF